MILGYVLGGLCVIGMIACPIVGLAGVGVTLAISSFVSLGLTGAVAVYKSE